ncbi:NitT/TauT family transport system permease protein [Actinoplanes lutulentus]|uniref:NitT/TauT family transport system permease protein n=1 Tax=Actinoplanes lutulentus TaxID=1287878 RepID=A0A327Z5H6_9ACTN|nr:ABC transporter permease [Actinoplanes lutulentus]MBB2946915.1 NitT/TauT family transport system permease protein [Actinoplanes lutulentus]RAK30418.1 NitT/TauT family transport system permease protein [Actinoplanes lutulentus]
MAPTITEPQRAQKQEPAAPPITRPQRRKALKYDSLIYGTVGLLGFLLVWWLVIDRGLISSLYLATPQETLKAFVDGIADGSIPADAWPSIQRAVIGFGIALVVGIVLGILVGSVPVFGKLAEPVLLFFRNLSLLALLPVFVAFLGIGEESKVAIVVWACFWPIFINAVGAVGGVERILINSARTLGAGRLYIFSQVVLPAALPSFFPGIRLAAANAFTALVAAELVGGAQGLGIYINNASYRFQTPQIYAGILTLGLLGILVNALMSGAERYLTRWQRGLTSR